MGGGGRAGLVWSEKKARSMPVGTILIFLAIKGYAVIYTEAVVLSVARIRLDWRMAMRSKKR
jgi:hypothetical protein